MLNSTSTLVSNLLDQFISTPFRANLNFALISLDLFIVLIIILLLLGFDTKRYNLVSFAVAPQTVSVADVKPGPGFFAQ